jgi:hypothetical protein
MNEIIERATSLYTQGLITTDELASLLAKEYAKLWARGQILALLGE